MHKSCNLCALLPSCSCSLHGFAYYRKKRAVLTMTADAEQASHAGCLFYFFSPPFRRPWLTVPTKQLSDPNPGLKPQEGPKICKYVPALMRGDYVQRRYESFINVRLLPKHVINEGRASPCFISIHVNRLLNRVCFSFSRTWKKGGKGC